MDASCLSWAKHKMTACVLLFSFSISSRPNSISFGLESCQNILAHTISFLLCILLPSNNALATKSQPCPQGMYYVSNLFTHINTSKQSEVQTLSFHTVIQTFHFRLFFFFLRCTLFCYLTVAKLTSIFLRAFKVCKDGLRYLLRLTMNIRCTRTRE